jgi:hypothetical protein
MNIYSLSNIPSGYYVYSYLRQTTSKIASAGTPYYIGKGIGKRAWLKGKTEIQPPTNTENIVILESGLTNIGALAIERRMIEWYGKIKDKTGILRNTLSGGDGFDSETCNRIPHNKDKKSSAETIQKQKDAVARRTEETRQKMVESGKRMAEKNFGNLTTKQRSENYKNSLGKLTKEERMQIGKIKGKKGGEKWSKASSNQVTVTDINGFSRRIPKDLFWTMKNDMIAHNIPIEQWQYVQVSSNESKKRKLKDGN